MCSDASGRLHSARLAWPGGTVLQVRRTWQGMVLGNVVDLSALPYLLHLIPGPSPSGHPRSVSLDRVGRERAASRGLACHRLESDCDTTLARPSGRGPDHCLGLSLCIWAGPGVRCCCAACWSRVLQGSGSVGDPEFMNPTVSFLIHWEKYRRTLRDQKMTMTSNSPSDRFFGSPRG